MDDIFYKLETNSKYSQFITRVFKIVNENLYIDLTVTDLADIVGVSQSYLSRIFKKEFGYGIKKYISSIIYIKSKKLLLNTDLSIKDISYELRFKDQYHFCKFFKNINGGSPSEYRSNFKESIKEPVYLNEFAL